MGSTGFIMSTDMVSQIFSLIIYLLFKEACSNAIVNRTLIEQKIENGHLGEFWFMLDTR